MNYEITVLSETDTCFKAKITDTPTNIIYPKEQQYNLLKLLFKEIGCIGEGTLNCQCAEDKEPLLRQIVSEKYLNFWEGTLTGDTIFGEGSFNYSALTYDVKESGQPLLLLHYIQEETTKGAYVFACGGYANDVFQEIFDTSLKVHHSFTSNGSMRKFLKLAYDVSLKNSYNYLAFTYIS